MPELPEVQTVVSGLKKLVVGKKIAQVDFDWAKSFPNDPVKVEQFLIGTEITDIVRRGKAIIFTLDSGYYLLVHLRMTGQLVYRGEENFAAGHPNDSFIGKLPDRSTRVTFDFSSGDRLFFNDQRKFGFVKLMDIEELKNDKFLTTLGPEPLNSDFNSEVLKTRLRRRKNTNIKAALLDQKTIAGLGNIYVDEALWCAKIKPTRRVGAITNDELNKLADCIQSVLTKSIELGGSTDKNYVDAEGKRGNYLNFAKVFRREGQMCERCGLEIIKIKHAGRGTHYCKGCQK